MRLLGSSRAFRAAGPRPTRWDPAPSPVQLFPPVFVVPKEALAGRTPAPSLLAPGVTWPQSAGASRGCGLRGGALAELGGCGPNGPSPGAARPSSCPASSRVLSPC